MLSLIKAHCFRIKGDWYLVYPFGWVGRAWLLPATALRRYIRFECLLGIFSLSLTCICLPLADHLGNLFAFLIFLFWLLWIFVVPIFLVSWYLGYVGGRKSNFDEQLLMARGMDATIAYQGLPTVQLFVFLWLFLLSIPFVVVWRMPYVWEHNDLMGAIFVTVLITGLALAGVRWFPRYMLEQANGVSLADIEPPAQ